MYEERCIMGKCDSGNIIQHLQEGPHRLGSTGICRGREPTRFQSSLVGGQRTHKNISRTSLVTFKRKIGTTSITKLSLAVHLANFSLAPKLFSRPGACFFHTEKCPRLQPSPLRLKRDLKGYYQLKRKQTSKREMHIFLGKGSSPPPFALPLSRTQMLYPPIPLK